MRGRCLHALLFLCTLSLAAGSAEINTSRTPFQPLGDSKLSEETQRAYADFYSGKSDAFAAFKSIVEKNPNDSAALYALAVRAFMENDFQQSIELMSKAYTAALKSPMAEHYAEQMHAIVACSRDARPYLSALQHSIENPETRPHLKSVARLMLADWYWDAGQFSAAEESIKPLQYVNRWSLLGPFDNRDNGGFSVVQEPETEIDFEKPLQGRNRRISWYTPTIEPATGIIDLSELFEPRIHVMAFAVSYVNAESDGWAVLRAGCAGALCIWVNQKKIDSVNELNDYGTDKIAAPVYLRKGLNQVLVKSAVVEETEWSFSVRFSKPDGAPLTGLTFETGAEPHRKYIAGMPQQKSEPPPPPAGMDLGLLRNLQDALRAEPANVSLMSALAAQLHIHRIGAKEESAAAKQLSKAIALAPKCVYLRISLAAYSLDSNEARQAAEIVYAADPRLPAALESLAVLAEASKTNLIAADYARQAMQITGVEKLGMSAIVLANLLSGQSGDDGGKLSRRSPQLAQRAEAWRIINAFVTNHPYVPEGWALLARLESTQSERRKTIQKGLSYCGGDDELRRVWTEELVEQGKDIEAAEFTAAAMRTEPYSVTVLLNLARQHQNAGRPEIAESLLSKARGWAPENPDLLGALGQLKHRMGKTTEAIELFREVLRLKPNTPQIKDYLSQLDSHDEERFYALYEIPLKDIPKFDAEAYPRDNIVHLLTQEVVRVNSNGSSSRMVHKISKLLRTSGVQELSRHQIYYEPDRQVVDIIRAAVITPDGREVSRADVSDRSTSAVMGVQTRIYDEHHLKQVTFKDLEPGSIVDLQYTIRDTGDNIFGDYFADVFYLSDNQPSLKSQYILDLPKTLPISARVFNSTALQERLGSTDTRREVFKWETTHTPGVLNERGMPPVVDKLAQLQVTSMKSWQDVGQWYWQLAKDQLVPSDELRTLTREITKDAKTATEKLRIVHDWVIREIRYLGIEFGRNGYKPHKASESFKALYGDCKDTATLITSMLQTIDIDCKLVLIRTVDAGAVPADSLALPNLFNHCIAYVPNVDGQEHWIDCTTDFYRLGELPWADQNAQVLVIDANGGKFVKIPSSTPQENLIEQKFNVKVGRNGSSTMRMEDFRHGQFAPGYRELAETPGQYERYMKEFAARRFNGGEVIKMELPPAGSSGPMWTKAEMKLPSLTSRAGERRAIPVTFEALNLSQRYANEQVRKHELELHFPWSRKVSIVFELDAALNIASLPDEAQIREPFGSYTRKLSKNGGKLSIDEELIIDRNRIPTAEYEAFKKFCNKVDSLLEQKVLLDVK